MNKWGGTLRNGRPTPFATPNATQEEIARLEKRDSAFAHLRKTGDRRPPVDVGAFNQELPGETPQASDG